MNLDFGFNCEPTLSDPVEIRLDCDPPVSFTILPEKLIPSYPLAQVVKAAAEESDAPSEVAARVMIALDEVLEQRDMALYHRRVQKLRHAGLFYPSAEKVAWNDLCWLYDDDGPSSEAAVT